MTVDPYLDEWRWRTPAQIAALKVPGLPHSKRGVNAVIAKRDLTCARDSAGRCLSRPAKGGGREYHEWCFAFSRPARQYFNAQEPPAEAAAQAAAEEKKRRSNRVDWPWYERLDDRQKAQAERRKAIVKQVKLAVASGERVDCAVCRIAERRGVGSSSIYNWLAWTRGFDEADWLPLLASRHQGKTKKAECSPEAWDFLVGAYLRGARPAFEQCYEWLKAAAAENGWTIPSSRTLRRRLEQDIPHAQIVAAREGPEALKRLYPPQERDRSGLHALEAVNADFYVDDVEVIWPDGTRGRPAVIEITDLYSNLPLAWRIDKAPNATAVRLAFYDVFRKYGIPDRCYLDNGREFAAKLITGGQPTRYRFKCTAGELEGVLTTLGVDVHWVHPYSGQSKPIERSFRERREQVAKNPELDGSYTGRSTMHKPHDYGRKAYPVEVYAKVLDKAHGLNAIRSGRRTKVCGGVKSFQQAFDESYARAEDGALIRRAGPEQLRMAMLAAEQITARKPSGAIHLLGNRYWAEFLTGFIGRKVTARFDPDDLQAGAYVYQANGRYLGFAECWEAVGFEDAAAAREHARNRRAFMKKQKELLALERRLSPEELVAMMPQPLEEHQPPETKVVRMVNGGSVAQPAPAAAADSLTDEEYEHAFSRGLSLIEGGRDDI